MDWLPDIYNQQMVDSLDAFYACSIYIIKKDPFGFPCLRQTPTAGG